MYVKVLENYTESTVFIVSKKIPMRKMDKPRHTISLRFFMTVLEVGLQIWKWKSRYKIIGEELNNPKCADDE